MNIKGIQFKLIKNALFEQQADMNMILRKSCVSVTEFKRHYASILAQADDAPVAVLNRNRP